MKKLNHYLKREILIVSILLIGISVNFALFSRLLNQSNSSNKAQDKLFEFDNLKVSGQEINITTPENITYTAPMSGYYPATYGFENDEDGNDPEEWVDLSGIGSDIQVISSFQGHNKILRGYDGDGGSAWNIRNNIPAREGTIELWWAVSSVAEGRNPHVDIRDNLNDPLFSVGCLGGNIAVCTSGGWYEIPGLTTTANIWDHIRIDFRSNSGTLYEGLNPNEFKLYYNGIDQGSYSFNRSGDSTIFRIFSGLAASGFYGYYDAIGYSWDPNYNIGDNLNEGLLLSFDTYPNLNWIGYSLDGQANKTILGNTTIPMPNDGLHSIQVFGNDSIGNDYQSNVRYFSVRLFETPSEPIISGYIIPFLIASICVVIIITIKKRFKK